ncbi:MAG TPA: MauE/DoxX family redox-associated membrane protein [Pyrinomonadaceae bacterium]|nr:MauE/DoxX family redox-associated membrane protein [Pyrinomonadaceae bacterium]
MRGLFRSHSSPSWLNELPRLILISLFTLTAIDKATHFDGVITALPSFGLLRAGTERFVAIFIITAEFAIALGLLLRRYRRPACVAAVLLLATFTMVSLVAPPRLTCGTWFTLTLNTGQPIYIFQNLVFIGLAIMAWMDAQPSAVESGTPSGSYPTRYPAADPNPTTET